MDGGTEEHSPILESSQSGFAQDVLGHDGPVLVVFWAPWSHPCQVLETPLREVARDCASWARVVKINADDCPELSLWYDVQSIPALLFFLKGTVQTRLVGTVSSEAILAKLRSISSLT